MENSGDSLLITIDMLIDDTIALQYDNDPTLAENA